MRALHNLEVATPFKLQSDYTIMHLCPPPPPHLPLVTPRGMGGCKTFTRMCHPHYSSPFWACKVVVVVYY
jgi:hypothetical protein